MNAFLLSGSEDDREAFEDAQVNARYQARESSRVSWRQQLEELRHHCGRGDTKSTWSWVKRFTKPRSHVKWGYPQSGTPLEYSETDEDGKQLAWVRVLPKVVLPIPLGTLGMYNGENSSHPGTSKVLTVWTFLTEAIGSQTIDEFIERSGQCARASGLDRIP